MHLLKYILKRRLCQALSFSLLSVFGFANGMKVKELVNNIDRFYRARMPDSVGAYTIPDEWRRKHSGAEPFFKKPKALA